MTPPTTQPAPPTPPINYFTVIGSGYNSIPGTGGGATTYTEAVPFTVSNLTTPPSPMSQYLAAYWDPMNTSAIPGLPLAGTPTVSLNYRNGILPAPAGATEFVGPMPSGATAGGIPTFAWKFPTFTPVTSPARVPGPANVPQSLAPGGAKYFWVCLRRPANPFAAVSQTNPMVVVDSMRFPYIDGTANPTGTTWTVSGSGYTPGTGGTPPNTIYSAQRLQPYRGGHAVPMPNALSLTATTGYAYTLMPPDPRYGYTEQTAAPFNYGQNLTPAQLNFGLATYAATGATTTYASTNYIYNTLGYNNDSAENWDHFPFLDRDFTSVAELLLVPGCPPGLFTKQFAELAPSQMNAADIFGAVTPIITPSFQTAFTGTATAPTGAGTIPTAPASAGASFLSVSQGTDASGLITLQTPQGSTTASLPLTVPALTLPTPAVSANTIEPHTFPYLVDKFFYTGASTFYYPPAQTALDPGLNGTSRRRRSSADPAATAGSR